ncbi:hypothetical protein [Streptomyces sp. NPDC050504]|uniref:hypothetical protein n=1 Tax=Streptomyces sp. NPDC050504 TaxID=3365618 RepID=UPI0037B4AAAC
MGIRRGLVLTVALAALTAAAVLLGPGAPRAEAASGCGGRLVKTARFATGELRVYKTRSHACAVTVAKAPGARRAMAVTLQGRGGRPAKDVGRYTQQAGPVTVYALNRCVRATGSVAGQGRTTGWILC